MIILGLGSNLGDRLSNLRTALSNICLIPELTISQVSPVYESDALLPRNAPKSWNQPYLNLAIGVITKLDPKQLLAKVKNIEIGMGRASNFRWSPRVVDIDILTWHDEYFSTNELKIPHSGLLERPFELWPLADIAPNWRYCEPNKFETGMTAEELGRDFGSRFDGTAPLHTKQIAHRVDAPVTMDILHLTPNLFSVDGKFNDLSPLFTQVTNLFSAGADIIDASAETTNSGNTAITVAEEWLSLQPLLAAWSSLWVNERLQPKLSINTCKPEIVEKILHYSYPVDFINNVSGVLNLTMQEVLKGSTAKVIFRHNLKIPTSREMILSDNATSSLCDWGKKQLENLMQAGISKERLIFDIGIEFDKNAKQNPIFIKNIERFCDLGISILVGHSRKFFLNQFTCNMFTKHCFGTAVFFNFLSSQVDYLRVHNANQNICWLKANAAQ